MTEHVGTQSFMGFEPHGHCFLWQPDLIALHAVSDLVTGVSYYFIPFVIFYFVKKRKDLPFPWAFLLFALFIVACGTTHLMSIWNVWHADYWPEGFVKLLTALVSLTTAIVLIPLMPKALAIPSPAQLAAANRKLAAEVVTRSAAELELQAYKDHLETLVEERTAALREANAHLEVEVNERKQAEENLLKAQTYITNIFDSMPSVLVGVDPQGVVTHWNKTAEAVMGMTARQAQGQLLGTAFPRLAVHMDNIRASLRERRPIHTERELFLTDGGQGYQDVMIYPLVCNGVDGAVVRVDDVTQRVHIEEMMVQSEKMMSVGGLAAGMAHEINNPLSAILQGAQVVLTHCSPDLEANKAAALECGVTIEALRCYLEKRRVFTFLEGIREAGMRAARIVSNMLEFTRKSPAQHSPASLNAILDRSVELALSDYDLKKKYDFKRIRIERHYAPALPEIPCNRTEIEQVVLNLLKNAAQAMTGQPDRATPPAITLRTALDRDAVRIEVEDNGPGMSERVRKRVFEPFFTTKEVGEGTGLGLSVSYFIIVTNHKGRIDVQSEPGKGTRFTLALPLK